MITSLNRRILTLAKLKGIGPAALQKLVDTPNFINLSISALAATSRPLDRALAPPRAWDNAIVAAEQDIVAAEQAGARILSAVDDEYPALLKNAPKRPFILYVKGQWSTVPNRSVAIIGTRQPTEHGAIIARRVSARFAESEWSIVSGLALGCDAIAHQTALDCKGHTVAVLGHGLHTIAPKQHTRLAARILEAGGALVAAYPFGAEPIPAYFVERDAVQAGMTRAVVMIQSDLKGGSLHASRAALMYGRVLAVPAPTALDFANQEPKSEANRILADGPEQKKISLLNCSREQLDNLVVVRSKDDYTQLFAQIESLPL